MNARDELRYVIHTEHCLEIVHSEHCIFWDEDRISADAVLAAGYVKHRTITTVEELDALPVESVVRDASGMVFEKDCVVVRAGENWWLETGSSRHYDNTPIDLPATVLHEGAQP